mgnify:FL=1
MSVSIAIKLRAVNQPKGTKNESNSQLIFTELHKLFNRQRTPGYSRKLTIIAALCFETMARKEELTTTMHAELMEGEMTREELTLWAVKGAMRRGLSKEEACKRYGFTVSEWEQEYTKLTSSLRGNS